MTTVAVAAAGEEPPLPLLPRPTAAREALPAMPPIAAAGLAHLELGRDRDDDSTTIGGGRGGEEGGGDNDDDDDRDRIAAGLCARDLTLGKERRPL